MSIVSLLVGQCGIQVGSEFFKTIYDDIFAESPACRGPSYTFFANESMDTFFSRGDEGSKPEAKCIQIDTEEKVICQIGSEINRQCAWRFSKNFYCSRSGSGNNWAHGYFLNGPPCMEAFDVLLKSEFEKCDLVDGLVTTMSLAGGTGSGVGTYLLTHLKDECPKVPVLAQLVWPYRLGEVVTQAYNAILSLGHLLESAGPSGFLLHENDQLHRACAERHLSKHQSGGSRHLVQVPLTELNQLMGHLLGGLLQPYIDGSSRGTWCHRRLSRLLFDLAGPTDYRLYRLHCLPYHLDKEARRFATETWAQLQHHGRQLLLTGACVGDNMNWNISLKNLRGYHWQPLLACVGVARGSGAPGDLLWSELTKDLLNPECTFQPWSESPSLGVSNRVFNGHHRGLFLATSGGGLVADPTESDSTMNTDVCAPLRLVRSRAWRLFSASAYLHQYAQYGLEDPRGSFLDAFGVVEQTIHSYSQLLSS